jgi:hypothetical protein
VRANNWSHYFIFLADLIIQVLLLLRGTVAIGAGVRSVIALLQAVNSRQLCLILLVRDPALEGGEGIACTTQAVTQILMSRVGHGKSILILSTTICADI